MKPSAHVGFGPGQFLLAGLVVGLWLCGQAPAGPRFDYSARLWQMEDGLPHNIVQTIAQTRDAYLWVGTREGLAQFDGVRFNLIELSPEVKHPSIVCLLETADGSFWVGTENAGLFRIGRETVSRLPAPSGSKTYSVYDLKRGGDSVWIASSEGVLEWAGAGLQRRGDFRNLIEALCVDPAGGVWLASGEGLRRLNGPATNCPIRLEVMSRGVRRAYCDATGTFWLATGNGLTELRDGAATYHHKADGPSGFVCALFRGRKGELWVGSYSGLSRYVDGTFVSESQPEDPSYQVYTFMEDREGNIWAGSEEGLTRFTPKAFRTYTKRDGLAMNRVVTVCASQGGGVWIGLHGGGLNHLKEDRFEVLNKAGGLSSDYVMAMCRGHDGSLWVGTDYGNGLNHLVNRAITLYGPPQGFVTAVTTVLLEDKDGTMWIGTRDGLQCLRGGRFTCYLTSDGLTHNKINALCLAREGGLWIGTGAGLCRWKEGRFSDLAATVPRLKTIILSLHEDAEGALWIATKGDGLLRWKQGTVQAFAGDIGLPSDSIYAVLEDRRGNLWLNGSRGIFQVSKQELEAVASGRKARVNSIAYGKADGILCSGQYGEVTQPAACEGTDGRLWFRTTQGVACVDPAKLDLNLEPPPVAIETVLADRRVVAQAPLLGALSFVEVPKGRGELEIHYTALSLRSPEKNRFKYRLAGVEQEWVEAGSRHSANYSKVAPGDYRFEVLACNNDGVWNAQPTSIGLRLEPHFWQTRTFLVTCILASVGAIAGTARYVTWRKMKRELERLEQQNAVEKERARIARDMHDELGAKLTRISFQGATAKRSLPHPELAGEQIEKMSQTARELVSSLDEIVWAVDPENDSLDNLANYICRYASEFFENSPVSCQFAIPTKLPHRRLPTDVRHNVFLAVKEVLNNVLKHAKASRLDLRITAGEDDFEIWVADNGCGFSPAPEDPAGLRRTGHGLVNIRERVASIGGRLELSSEPGKGTRMHLVVPLAEIMV